MRTRDGHASLEGEHGQETGSSAGAGGSLSLYQRWFQKDHLGSYEIQQPKSTDLVVY